MSSNRPHKFDFLIEKKVDKELKKRLKNKEFRYSVVNEYYEMLESMGYDLTAGQPIKIWLTENLSTRYRTLPAHVCFYENNHFNGKTKTSYKAQDTYNTIDEITKHLFPLESFNKSQFKKGLFIENDGDIEKNYRINYVNKSVRGSTLKEYSDVLFLDYDCHGMDKDYNDLTAKVIKQYFGTIFKSLIISEVSAEGGYHFWIKLDKQYSLYHRNVYIKDLYRQLYIKLDTPDRVRFPASVTYEMLSDNNSVLNKLNIPYYYKNQYENATGFPLSKYCKFPEEKTVTEKIKIIPIEKKKIPEHKKLKRKFKTPSSGKTKFYSVDDMKNDPELKLYSGSSNETIKKIINRGKFNNISDEDIYDIITHNNINSNILSESKEYMMQRIRCLKKSSKISSCSKSELKEFNSNIKLIPQDIIDKIDNSLILSIITHNIKRKCSYSNMNKVKIDLLEILGVCYYNVINPQESLTNNINETIGIQVSKKYCQLLKKHYPELSTTEVQNLSKSILQLSGLFTQFYSNNRGWFFHPEYPEFSLCKQYILSSDINTKTNLTIESISSFIRLSIESMIKNFIQSIKKNKIIYYYLNILIIFFLILIEFPLEDDTFSPLWSPG